MADTYNVGESASPWVQWRKPKYDGTLVPTAATVNTLVVTRPDATTVTVLIGAQRVGTDFRYATDVSYTMAGTWRWKWTASGTYTDEDGNVRAWTGVFTDEARVIA